MKSARRIGLLILILISMLSSVGSTRLPGDAILDKISPLVLEDTLNGQSAAFILVLSAQADTLQAARLSPGEGDKAQRVYAALQSTASASQTGLVKALKREGAAYQTFTLVNAIRVEGDLSLVKRMAARADIAYIASDRVFRVPLEEADRFQPVLAAPAAVEWNIQKVNADDLWALGMDGDGIVYANADTGIDWQHPALKNQYRGWSGTTADHAYAWWDAAHEELSGNGGNPCGYSSPVPCDDHGHGTHTMGTGIGSDGSNQVGVAPGARWIGCRNMENGYGRPSTYLECLDFFLAPWDLNHANPNPALHADVVGNSYTCPTSELCNDKHIMQAALANLRAAGIFMSVSAGNGGPACSTIVDPPAIENAAITIGATYSNDTIAEFSSRGPVTLDGTNLRKPDLVAPGVDVRSAAPGGGYTTMSGTSMSAPLVAGVVALLWSGVPELRGNVDATEALLEVTAVHLTSSQCGDGPADVPNNVFGYGRVDALAAFQNTLPPVKWLYLPLLTR